MANEALRAAARVFADAVKRNAAVVSQHTADAVNISEGMGGEIEIRAGVPGGPWGWHPIQAWMFDEGAMHPLYGDKKHWYRQRHWPFIELAVRTALDHAADVYADKRKDELLAEYGFK